ncbi:MAG: patatin-like phospholipase family protein [Myxococcales bacterium]|nr:patatin-like phospholipase family protein [Myxococcales bacterium]
MLALVFEGCANRAAFAAGVAAELAAAGVAPGLVAGASSGAIIAAGVAAGRSRELPALWTAVAGRSIVAWRQLARNRSPFAMSAIVGDALAAALGDGDLRAAPGEALCTVTRLRDGQVRVLSSRREPDFVRAVLGSCFIPVLYGRIVRIDGAVVVDGGARDNLPMAAVAAGARRRSSRSCRPPTAPRACGCSARGSGRRPWPRRGCGSSPCTHRRRWRCARGRSSRRRWPRRSRRAGPQPGRRCRRSSAPPATRRRRRS